MKKQDFFCQIFVTVGISIEGLRAHWATPLATPMILRQDRALKFFHKKDTFKSKFKKNFFSKMWKTRVKSLTDF